MPLFNNVLAGAAGSGGADAGYKISRSLRFNPGDGSHLTKTYSSSGNRRTFTLSYWIKECGKGTSPSNNPHILWSGADVNTRGGFVHRGTGSDANKLYLFNQENTSTNCSVWSNSLHRDFSAWKNIVWAVDTTQSTASNRVKLYVNGVQETLNFVTTPAQNLELQINLNQEHRIGRGFPDDYGNYMLAEMHFVDGQQINPDGVFGEFDADTGVWNPIEHTGTYGTNGFYLDFSDNSSNAALGTDSSGANNTWTVNNLNAVNVSGGAPSVTANTIFPAENTAIANLWNGATSSYPGDFVTAADGGVISIVWPTALPNITKIEYYTYNGNDRHEINNGGMSSNSGSGGGWKTAYFDPSNPINLTSLKLQKANGSSYVKIGSIKINDVVFTTSTYSSPTIITDSFVDSPTNYEASSGNNGGNYATLNPLQTGSSLGLANGNLALDGHSSWRSSYSTIFLPTGKWYFEVTIRSITTHSYGIVVGLAGLGTNILESEIGSGDSYAVQNGPGNMKINHNGGSTDLGSQSAYAVGDVLQLAYDADNGKLWFGKNGTYINSGNPSAGSNESKSGINGSYCFAIALLTTSDKIDCNFGQRSFAYSAPTNFKAVCTQNLDDPLIADGSNYFAAVKYTGNGGTQSIGGPVYSATSTMSSPTQAFNGDTSNGSTFNSTGNSVLTAGSMTITSSLEIYHNRTGSDGITVNINGTNYTATGLSSNGYHTIPIPNSDKPLTTTGNITIKDNQSGAQSTVYAVRVDSSVLVDGTGESLSFSPDFLWIKNRTDSSAAAHRLFDTVRGASKTLFSNLTNDELEVANSLTSFDSNGFTVGSGNWVNGSGDGIIAWAWDGGDLVSNSTSSHNQSQTWSNGWTGNSGSSGRVPTNAFDGDLTTLAFPGNNSANEYVEYSFTAIPVNTSLEFYLSFDSGGAQRGQLWVNDTNVTSSLGSGNAQWFTVTGQSTLSKIKILTTATNYYVNLHAVRVDGKILIDPGIIPAASLNSSVYNTSENWVTTGTVTGTPAGTGYTFSPLFDGNLTSLGPQSNSMTQYVYTFANTLSATANTIIFYSTDNIANEPSANTGGYYINGTQVTTSNCTKLNSSSPYKYRMDGLTTLSSIGTQQKGNLTGIEVNGKLLIDSNAHTPPNVPLVTSTCRTNQTAGMSIVSYSATGSDLTVAHNLNAKPSFIILKSRNVSGDWLTMFSALGEKDFMKLNETNPNSPNASNVFLGTTSTTFKTGNDAGINSSGQNKIAYCFAPVEGYSAMGSYVGGSSPFVYTGFKPRFVLAKNVSGSFNWFIADSARATSNPFDELLYPNTSDAETTSGSSDNISFNSNGFTIEGSGNTVNQSGSTFVYLAFAEHPFKTARAR